MQPVRMADPDDGPGAPFEEQLQSHAKQDKIIEKPWDCLSAFARVIPGFYYRCVSVVHCLRRKQRIGAIARGLSFAPATLALFT